MNRERFARRLAAVTGMLLLFGAVGMAFSQSASPDRGRPPISIASAAQPQRGTLEDDFAGMSFTDDQQQQINKIRQETAAHTPA